jgi:hypothetical protein
MLRAKSRNRGTSRGVAAETTPRAQVESVPTAGQSVQANSNPKQVISATTVKLKRIGA